MLKRDNMSGEQTENNTGMREKAAVFVQRLWENPALGMLPPLQKEAQLRQFLEVNAGALKPTLSSPAFFPGQSWPEILRLLHGELVRKANAELEAMSQTVLEKNVGFSFVQHLARQGASLASVQTQMEGFLRTLSGKALSRKELGAPLLGVGMGLVDRYMEQVYKRQKYINFELRKVQRLKISSNEVTDLVKVSMLIRPVVRYFSQGSANEAAGGALLVSPAFAEKVAVEAARMLNLMPEGVIKAGVNSSLSFLENPYVEGTARLAAVFAHRCRNLKPGMKAGRGAESSDKSWFSVARKNYKFYGFDLDLLVELHGIAAENGW